MSLSDRFSDIAPSESGLPCGIAKILKDMPDKDVKALEAVLAVKTSDSRRISNRQIQNVLLSEGYDIAYASIALHRRKQCRCFVGKSTRSTHSEEINV
jgi:hypothetical protein